jgi:hypothetical protein
MRSIIDALDFSVVAGLGHTSMYCKADECEVYSRNCKDVIHIHACIS